ncbi:hypothetical protein Ahy_B09g095452 isoform I [Arachis hypogaea]|uniref:Ubiquitin-like protease family profile domain-containing protein n=1 Tax=Arachis hypogaea TaxID=3818 RepID=A0A444XEJ5_ARAHY|nr:hypothetical protein Ahy_B09g095452 isoform I [Arachis hypogaea]
MARTIPYVPKTDPGVPSFSLGLTDSSQEGASTQETERAKSPESANLIEELDNLVQKIASSACMALSDHPKGEFVSPKTEKEFRVEAYPSFIPFIDRKKLTSHPYIFAPVCHMGHWWLWLINTTKQKCHILDPLHKRAPSDKRKQVNKFTGYVFSRLITYAGGEPLQKGENEKKIKSSYVKISGQKTSYDCAIYVMKWMELIEPENIKKGKYEWDNWPQVTVFRTI